MLEGLLPVGTVVLLKESTRRLMIIGVCQREVASDVIWDYAGCLYPEGYMGADKVYLFNHDQIEHIYSIGYQDEDQKAFKEKVDILCDELRNR
ncbi:DUF4176 domain-containing protein [Lachnoclostridium sp.]|uniref:DUF4176 domain-containing protein n=1 Tax=Lachnoclostridium sp. TaxID=2028282 RepID=UPI00289A7C97|nr:DUF4176 domain-containing protein [Lachnoclostridium sp.]